MCSKFLLRLITVIITCYSMEHCCRLIHIAHDIACPDIVSGCLFICTGTGEMWVLWRISVSVVVLKQILFSFQVSTLFVPLVKYGCCAGKWTVPTGRTALVYSFTLSGSFVWCIWILHCSGGTLSSVNNSGNVCCLVASGICRPAHCDWSWQHAAVD